MTKDKNLYVEYLCVEYKLGLEDIQVAKNLIAKLDEYLGVDAYKVGYYDVDHYVNFRRFRTGLEQKKVGEVGVTRGN